MQAHLLGSWHRVVGSLGLEKTPKSLSPGTAVLCVSPLQQSGHSPGVTSAPFPVCLQLSQIFANCIVLPICLSMGHRQRLWLCSTLSPVSIYPLKALFYDNVLRRQRAAFPGRWEIGKGEDPFLDLTLIFLHQKLDKYLCAFTQPVSQR